MVPQRSLSGDARRVGVLRAVGITALAGVPGTILFAAAHALGWTFPSWGILAVDVVLALIQLTLLAALCTREGGRFDRRSTGAARGARPLRRPTVGEVVAVTVLVIVCVAVLPALIGDAVAAGSTYGPPITATVPLTLAMVLVRYPLTVFAEEALFRGWLQPRLTWAPPVLSGILWGAYHVFVQPVSTVPTLMCMGVALGLIRRWTGDVRATFTIHYLLDASFFVVNYR